MTLKRHLLIWLTVLFTYNIQAQNIFELKGKSIILTSNKIAYKGYCHFANSNKWEYSYHNDFGNIYNSQVLEKFKFTKKNLYSGNIVGKPVFVRDVHIINPDKTKKRAIVMLLNTPTDTLVMYLPLYLKSNGYFDIDVKPQEINLCYHDCGKIAQLNNQMKHKHFYFKSENTLYTFDSITVEKELLCIKYHDNAFNERKYHIRAYSTEEHVNYGHLFNDLDAFTSSVVLEDDLIAQCKQQHPDMYINSLRDKFLNKEVFLYTGTKMGFFTCSYFGIKNIGTNSPSYDYILTLQNEKESINLPIYDKNMDYITLADEYRERIRLEEEKRRQEEAEYRARLEKEEREYKSMLIRRFGKKNAMLIHENAVQLGFTKEMCIEAWGEPYDINRTITQYGVHEQWVYDIGRYLYFEGNVLTGIQD